MTAKMVLAFALSLALTAEGTMGRQEEERVVSLPAPRTDGTLALERALSERVSTREFRAQPLPLSKVGQLLWAAQGRTHGGGRRTAPSAGALYPLEVYLLAGEVEGLEAGLYRYQPHGHTLLEVTRADLRAELAEAALEQEFVGQAPAVIVVAGVVERTARKYGGRATRYMHMEVGAVAQNVYLQATALGLGTVFVGAFSDSRVADLLSLRRGEEALAILPVGRPR
jgi:SagB-type dehydrogenase family enzyme